MTEKQRARRVSALGRRLADVKHWEKEALRQTNPELRDGCEKKADKAREEVATLRQRLGMAA